MKYLLIPSILLAASCTAATFKYDALNRLTKVEYSPGLAILYTYDASGNRVSRTVGSTARTITATAPFGGGSVSGGGPTTVGAVASLLPAPDPGNQFVFWKENGSIVSYASPLTFVVTTSRELEAYFSPVGSYTAIMAQYRLDPATDGHPSSDPDKDGLANLLEYALSTDPVAPNALDSLIRHETSDGIKYFVLEFDCLDSATGSVSIGVEHSSDLAAWKTALDGVDGVTVTATSLSPTKNRLQFRIPMTNPNIFARLKFTKPDE